VPVGAGIPVITEVGVGDVRQGVAAGCSVDRGAPATSEVVVAEAHVEASGVLREGLFSKV
jgi:hypothetical protein